MTAETVRYTPDEVKKRIANFETVTQNKGASPDSTFTELVAIKIYLQTALREINNMDADLLQQVENTLKKIDAEADDIFGEARKPVPHNFK